MPKKEKKEKKEKKSKDKKEKKDKKSKKDKKGDKDAKKDKKDEPAENSLALVPVDAALNNLNTDLKDLLSELKMTQYAPTLAKNDITTRELLGRASDKNLLGDFGFSVGHRLAVEQHLKSNFSGDLTAATKRFELQTKYNVVINDLRAFLPGLQDKKNLLQHQINVREDVKKHVRDGCCTIELETQREFEDIKQRLHDERGRKLAILDADVQALQSDIQEVDSMVSCVTAVHTTCEDRVRFVDRCHETHTKAAMLVRKPFKTTVDVDPTAYTHEWNERRKADEEKDNTIEMLTEERENLLEERQVSLEEDALKDSTIRMLTDEQEKLVEEREASKLQIQQLEAKTRSEVNEWIKLTDRFAETLESLRCKCAYCSQVLAGDNVNSFCSSNVPRASHTFNVNVTSSYGGKGSGLHLWVRY